MSVKCPKCQTDNPETAKFCSECATLLHPSKDVSVTRTLETSLEGLTRGTTFAERYEIIEELGRGGMGVVYKAEDTKLKRTVALKFLPPELTHIPDVKDRFMREAQAAAALDHPNICTVYEFDEAEEKTFISMAYVEGQSLRKKLESGPLELDEALRIATQVAEGLQEAHKKGVVHRDIKSANIMVTEEGQAKIMDFGLARMPGGTLLTQEGMAMGTIAYMSPEQARGEEVDHRTDIWSLGVVLYEMFSGQLPFRGEHDQAVVYSILNEQPQPITELQAEIPMAIEQIVGKTLEKNLDERYQQVGELLDDLKSISAGIVPEEIKVRLRRAKLLKRKRVILYAGIAGLIITMVVIALAIFTGRAETIDSIAILPLENRSGDPDQEYFVEGMHEDLITELSKIRALKVIARPSVMRYKNSDKSILEIAKELNVSGIVAGSALQDGGRVRITIQLIKAETEQNIWAEKYDKDYRDIPALHGEVAQDIAQEIKIAVTPQEKERLSISRQVDQEAHEAYLKGRYFWSKMTAENLDKSIEYYNLAIEKDPNYAMAYVGLAESYKATTQLKSLPPKDLMIKAKEAVIKAIELDDSIADAHATLGHIKGLFEWDVSGAERELKRAIQLNPNSARARLWYGQFLNVMNEHEKALEERKKAKELDPLSNFFIVNAAAGYSLNHQYDKAIEEYQKAIEFDPDYWVTHWGLGKAYAHKKLYEKSIPELQKAIDLLGGKIPLPDLGYVFGLMGRTAEAQKILDVMEMESRERYIPPTYFAIIYLGLGELDKVFEWLDKAYEVHDRELLWIAADPMWDSLRSDSRFKALLKKIGLNIKE